MYGENLEPMFAEKIGVEEGEEFGTNVCKEKDFQANESSFLLLKSLKKIFR